MRDLHRPVYHFQPAPSWINDPIPFYGGGAYHVFYQYHPGQPYWGNMHWGHAVSRDLAHWEDLPIAMAPTKGSPDDDGVWTGCVVQDGAVYRALYTGVTAPEGEHRPQTQCLATSSDLLTWEKYPGNPVIGESLKPEGYGDTFRDPHVWREGVDWLMALGGMRSDGHGAVFLYRSSDLHRWEYLHVLYEGEAVCDECPDFFPLDGKHVLISSRDQTKWAIGTYRNHRFLPERYGWVDPGDYYAAKTLLDDKGRRILFGWVREGRSREEQIAAGWSGALSLPRVLTVLPDGTLGMEPPPELAALRGRHRTYRNLEATEGLTLLQGAEGDCVEVAVRMAVPRTGQAGVAVLCSPDGEEQTRIGYDAAAGRLLDMPLDPGAELEMRIFVDRSIIEVYVSGRAQTIRSYPKRADAVGIGLFAIGGPVKVHSVDVWELGGGVR